MTAPGHASPPAPLLTLEQVCERVQLSPWAVRRAISHGELLAYKLRGRLRIPASAVEDWVRASLIEPDIITPIVEPQLPTRTSKASATFRERLRKGSHGERSHGGAV